MKTLNQSIEDHVLKIKQLELANLKLTNQVDRHLSDIAELKHDFDVFKTTAESELNENSRKL
jgi:CRISPR/Cas system-associated endonuclease/helicase Cas3